MGADPGEPVGRIRGAAGADPVYPEILPEILHWTGAGAWACKAWPTLEKGKILPEKGHGPPVSRPPAEILPAAMANRA